jgi:transposase
VATLLEKTKGEIDHLDHCLTFVDELSVNSANNIAERALREPIVLRKIIVTLHIETEVFVHETSLSLLAQSSQQRRNPYEEFSELLETTR